MDTEPPSLFLASFFHPFSADLILPLLILLTLLLCSALISASEVAFFSLKKHEVENLKGNKFEKLNQLLNTPKTLLATILISNNFINVGIVILSSYITNALVNFSEYPGSGRFFQVVVITFTLLLFGEVLPKVYATRKALSFSLFMSLPMSVLRTLFKPVSLILVRSTALIEKRLSKNTAQLSVDDLSQALELTSDENGNEDEQKILEGIVKFGSTTVKQIMKARMDVICVDITWDYKTVLELIVNSGFSRIPVYEENFDQIKGTLYIKDLLPHTQEPKNFEWQKLLRESFFVPENKKIDDLLKEFQEKKIHLAVVVDEFGGTSGIVTLEDVIEEIVGDISDEFDDEEIAYSKLDNRNFVFEGKTHLTDFVKVIDVSHEVFEEASGDADTLAGFVIEVAGKIPSKNEQINFEGYGFTIESTDGRRIERIKVTLPQDEN